MASHEGEQLQKNRRKRVERLKKIILTIVFSAIVIPILLCICLGVLLHSANIRLRQSENEKNELQVQFYELQKEVDALQAGMTSREEPEDTPQDDTILESENSRQDVMTGDGIKRVYLTFDDGPSANTAEILDILAEYDVKATFFVVGNTDEEAKELYRRIIAEGHSLGIHSYSHKYGEIYSSEENFFEDFYFLSDYLYDVTGVRPDICRLPGGSSNTVSKIDMAEIVNKLEAQGITCFDWNISGGDADGHNLTSNQIAENVLNGVDNFQTSIVLLHDGGDKAATVQAVRMILEDLTGREDLEIKPITEETPIILHITH